MTLHQIAEACGGKLLRGDGGALAGAVTIDSRQAKAGDLFVAIKGERFDGHDYLAEAAARARTSMRQVMA